MGKHEPIVRAVSRRRPRWPFVLAAGTVLLVGILALMFVRTVRSQETYDVVIDNATIVDGTGAVPFRGGVGIRDGRIAAVWTGRRWTARGVHRHLNARGLVLAPGFIDTHSHADVNVTEQGGPIRADNFVAQGVTTLITGNCGRSPLAVEQFRKAVNRHGSNVNIATLVGLNTLRRSILGESSAPLDERQLRVLTAAADRSMRAGALGVSTGFEYVPGRFATEEEVVAILRVATRFGGVHTSHVRNEGHRVLASVNEAIRLSSSAGVPLLVSHLKITGRANCSMLPRLESLIRGAPRAVYVDQYPYAASSTDLDIYLPDWYLREGPARRREILRKERERLKDAITGHLFADGFRDLSFMRVSNFVHRPEWNGRTIREIALRESGNASRSRQLDTMLQIVERGGAQMIYHNICPDAVLRIQRDLAPMIGSDSSIRFTGGRGLPHPRGWGAFAKFLGYSVRERGVASLPQAIRQMTDLPARFFGIPDRGRISPRYVADLVVFDSAKIRGRASYLVPLRPPEGIWYVLVAGEFVVDQRSRITSSSTDVTDATPGRFIARLPRLSRGSDGLAVTTLTSAPTGVTQAQTDVRPELTP